MTRRRKILLSSAILLAFAGVLALPGVHWRLIGWAKSESFYKGRPTTYYAWYLRRLDGMVRSAMQSGGVINSFETNGDGKIYVSSQEAWVRIHVGDWAGDLMQVHPIRFGETDPASVPVLTELMDFPDPVRRMAVSLLSVHGPASSAALPRLRVLCSEIGGQDPDFREAVETTIRRIDPDALKDNDRP